ncbi:MAG: hypothetical protein KDD70_17860, partial [Bdellovibrionales bacterium]|nr:hypothetical protein [Bdellovibrionales bacterium]
MSCLIGTIAKSLLSESADWSFTNAIEYAHTLPHHATSVTKVDCFTVAASRRVVGSPGSAVVHDEAYGAVCGVDGLLAQRESSELVQEIDHALFLGSFQALAQKGSFSGFYFNQITERLSLFTDPLGQIPLYYSYNSHQVFFSTLPAAILEAAPPHTLHVNDRALSALLVYEHLMGEDTLFQEIKRVPPGSVIHFEIGSLSSPQKIHYWSIENIQEQSYHSLSEAAEEVFPSFKRAITDSASFCTRPCVFLTGGLDSRTIAGTLFDQTIPFQSFTYGIDSCRDIELAKLVALEVKSPLT